MSRSSGAGWRPDARISEFNRPVVAEFRASGGRVGGMFEGGDLLLLTTVGARTGLPHTVPLGYLRVGGRLLVVASAGGSPRHPDWYHNVLARPLVEVEIGTERYAAVAVPLEGAERDEAFAEIVRREPGYGDYQARTERVLPVVALERAYAEQGAEGDADGDAAVTDMAAMLLRIHGWLREQLGQVRVQAEEYFAARAAHTGPGAPPPPGLGLRIRQHCLAFCQSLWVHHVGEDEHLLPRLESEHPELAGVVARLRAEHAVVARIRADLEALLADVTTADPDRFRADLDRMTAELESHLAYEEEHLIPLLASVPFPPVPPGA